jgi:hypothetical protein
MLKTSSDPSSSRKIPLAALIPGVLGLIPFWGLALSLGNDLGLDPLTALLGLLAYGAVILSFVGALWWGIAANMAQQAQSRLRNAMFLWSVFPALIGWFAMLLVPDLGLILLMSGFALQCLLDFMLHKRMPAVITPWMLKLRVILTAGACTALVYAWHHLRTSGLI